MTLNQLAGLINWANEDCSALYEVEGLHLVDGGTPREFVQLSVRSLSTHTRRIIKLEPKHD